MAGYASASRSYVAIADAPGIDPTARALLEPFRRRAPALGV